MAVRYFLVSNQISALFAAHFAQNLFREGDNQYLLIDQYYKKESLIKVIKETRIIYEWKSIVDFSYHISDQNNLKPGLRKTWTRKIKHLPLINWFYKGMLQIYTQRYNRKQQFLFFNQMKAQNLPQPDQIYLLTQTALNPSLINGFPGAEIVYYEHGIGDYLYYIKNKLQGHFSGVFSEEFYAYYSKHKQVTYPNEIRKIFKSDHFKENLIRLSQGYSSKLSPFKEKKCVLFLMDALEGYNPPQSLWTDYLNKSLEHIQHPQEYVFLIKPHPNQSNEVIEITTAHCRKLNLNYVMLDDPEFVSCSSELIFAFLHQEISFLISTFSSSIFYMARIFPENCKYLLLYKFVEPYLQNGPKQYLDHYYSLEQQMKEIFWSEGIVMI